MADFDLAYINKITKTVANLFLKQSDVGNNLSAKHKHSIQHAVNDRFFGVDDHTHIGKNSSSNITSQEINAAIDFYKKANSESFKYIYDYRFNVQGIGRGEFFIFLLYDKARLGGSGAAAADISVGSKTYEVKEVPINSRKLISNLKTGGGGDNFEYSKYIKRFYDIGKSLGFDKRAPGGTEFTLRAISRKSLEEMRKDSNVAYMKALNDFKKDIVNSYFKGHPIIWMDKNKERCIDVVEITEKHIPDIQVITQSIIKPFIQL